MAELIDIQAMIYDSIVKLGTNIKKDSADRKTLEYFKRRLSTLEEYWREYEGNHDRISGEVSKSHSYFVQKEFEKTFKAYEDVKILINQQYQKFLGKSGKPGEQEKSPYASTSNALQPEEEGPLEDAGPSSQNQIFKTNTGTNSRLDELLRRQQANFKAFLRTTSNINVETISEKWEFEDGLKILEARWSTIDNLHWEIESELEEENESYNYMFDKYEKQFISLKKTINKKMWSVVHRNKSTPQLEIPVFTGNYNQWVSFRDLFTEAIHNNTSLSNGQKMQYLKSKVRGEAEKLIQHLHISTDNYLVAWDILTHRYNNKKLIFSSHMNILMNLPNMQQQSVHQIKRIHDSTLECLNGIKNLGVDISSWDPIVVHILGQKLDNETYTDYLESLKDSRELPALRDFLGFLETKFTTLETAHRKQDNGTQKHSQTKYNQSPSNLKKHLYNSYNKTNNSNNNFYSPNKSLAKSMHVTNIKCPMCNNQHGIYNCKTYLALSDEQKLKTAYKLKLCTNCLFSHNGNKCNSTLTCRKCLQPHNTILHEAFTKQPNFASSSSSRNIMTQQQEKQNDTFTSHASQNDDSEILLATALVKVKDSDGSYCTMRALIDQGSQISLITERAAQLLNIKRQRCKGVIFGVGQRENNCKGVMSIECASLCNNFTFEAEVFIMTNLIKCLPNKSFPKPDWSHINNIQLADPEFYKSRAVDLLLGADIYANIILSGIIKSGNAYQPLVQQTQLGWLLCGNVKTYQCNVVLNNIEEIKRFWQVEEISESSPLSVEDKQCLEFYESTTKRTKEGRYEVRIPLKEELKHNLGLSKPMAIAQLKNLERKFNKQEQLASKYRSFMNEYLELHHMKPEETNVTGNLQCYLPHHGVQRDESLTTKLRVVFNASAKTSTKLSLNDIMYKGPNMQRDLQSLLLQWRQYPYAFTADLEKMYRQIRVNNLDQHLQKIVWRDSPEQQIQSFQLTTVTYGTKAAPFLAIRTLKQLAADERSKHPEAAEVLENAFFVDDLLHGTFNIEQAKYIINQLIQLLKLGGFNLRKWAANKQEVLDSVAQNTEETSYNFKNEDTSKTLGLCWQTKQDYFTFNCNFTPLLKRPTKRQLLSEISKLFDPLGWLTPLSTKLKLLFQKLWKTDLLWDDVVSDDIYREWSKLTADIHNIKNCVVPRWILTQQDSVIEFHGFCDASTEAYACAVYARTKTTQQTILVAGKSKLVPHKKAITLPRIELCGAYLLSQLINKIKKSVSCPYEIYGWCDSMVVLSWLHGDTTRWKPFVANRVRAITQIMPSDQWRYVKSADNAADCASRGLTVSQLVEHPLWWHGPSWLASFDGKEKHQQSPMYTTEEETKKIKQVNIVQQDINIIDNLLNKYSSFRKVVRVFAWILRALTSNIQRKHLPSYLTLQELRKSKLTIIKTIQRKEYADDIGKIIQNGKVGLKSKLLNLNCFIDSDGILRVGGRLRHANINLEMKHPKIIPNKTRLAELLIDESHLLTFHGGPKLTLATLRNQYWITGGIRTTKAQLRNCVICRKTDARKQYQVMGDLPAARSNPAPPFYHTGVDYTGFLEIKANKGRGVRTTKGYVAVFVCMVTKAVHLELVSDLTSSAFLAAISRMAARRGTPRHLYSDQGTNFIGANRILQEEYEQIQQAFGNTLFSEVADMNIEWHFNAPSWPSAGGLWERAVRSLKHHLKRVVGEQRLTFEEYSTILTKLEACLNSRPLCSLTENIEDLNYLSPAHFLTGRAGLTVIETKFDARTRWHLTSDIFRQIWHKWKTEYLTQLTAREKWNQPQRNMKIGDMVVVHEDNVPAGKWIMGRVIDVHPGSDGYVRVVTLRTKTGIIKRPVVKLSILPVETAEQRGSTPATNSEPTVTRKNMKPVSFSHIVMALTFFMACCGNVTGTLYNVTTFSNEQSLFFDPIGKLSLAKDKWTLVIYYDMSPYWEGIKAFNKIITYLDITCKTIGSEHCNTITSQLLHEANELKYYNQLLLTQQSRGHSRRRRGFINGVGYLANTLFGVLDEHFAEKYTRDIQLIRNNENHIVELWKNQTSIIESEYNILQRTASIMNKQHKIINQHLMKLNNRTNKLQQEINNISLIQDFTLMSLTASNLLHNLKGSQDTLVDILSNLHHGQFNIHLLTPEQLQTELNTIAAQLSDDTMLPVEPHNIRDLYPLLHLNVRLTEYYFLFQVTLPLIGRDKYKLYRMTAIPHQYENSMIELIPQAEYIATDLKRSTYITFTSDELALCVKQETWICDLKKPVYHQKSNMNFCELDSNTEICKIKKSRCEDKWISLTNPSHYLYYCCDKCTINVICGEQICIEHLYHAGIMSIEPGCLLRGHDFTLHIPKLTESRMNASSHVYSPIIDQLNFLINTSMTWMNLSEATDSNDLEFELNKLHHRIDEIKNNREELGDTLSSHDVHLYAVSYILVGAGAVAAGALWCRRWQQLRVQRARISPDIELQPVENSVVISARMADRQPSVQPFSASAGLSKADRQPSVSNNSESVRGHMGDRRPHIYGEINKCVVKNQSCSPIPRRHLELRS